MAAKRWTHRCTAIGSSHEPGTVCTTMLDSLTPHSRSLAFVPSSNGSMILSFQRAWTMPMRRPLPSWSCGDGPLLCMLTGVERSVDGDGRRSFGDRAGEDGSLERLSSLEVSETFPEEGGQVWRGSLKLCRAAPLACEGAPIR